MSMSSNDTKAKIRLSIKRHRQKLLQSLGSGDTYLRPKIESVSNYVEKSYLNYNVKPKSEVIDSEPTVTVIKKLSEQLIEEIQYSDNSDYSVGGSFEDSEDDNISVGDKDWKALQTHNDSDLDENDKIDFKTAVKFDGPIVNDTIGKISMDHNDNSVPELDAPNIRLRRQTRKNINYFEKPQKIPQPKLKTPSLRRKEANKNWRSARNATEKNSSDNLKKRLTVK